MAGTWFVERIHPFRFFLISLSQNRYMKSNITVFWLVQPYHPGSLPPQQSRLSTTRTWISHRISPLVYYSIWTPSLPASICKYKCIVRKQSSIRITFSKQTKTIIVIGRFHVCLHVYMVLALYIPFAFSSKSLNNFNCCMVYFTYCKVNSIIFLDKMILFLPFLTWQCLLCLLAKSIFPGEGWG